MLKKKLLENTMLVNILESKKTVKPTKNRKEEARDEEYSIIIEDCDPEEISRLEDDMDSITRNLKFAWMASKTPAGFNMNRVKDRIKQSFYDKSNPYEIYYKYRAYGEFTNSFGDYYNSDSDFKNTCSVLTDIIRKSNSSMKYVEMYADDPRMKDLGINEMIKDIREDAKRDYFKIKKRYRNL